MYRSTFLRSKEPITIETIGRYAPSVLADKPWAGVSDSYAFLPTIKVVNAIQDSGMACYSVRQSGTRREDMHEYTKHKLEFRQVGSKPIVVNDVFYSVSLTNSHNRGSSFILNAGLHRLACSNGLTVSIGNWPRYSVRHQGSATIDNVLSAVYAILNKQPEVEGLIQRMVSTQLTLGQQEQLAGLALGLRWPDSSKAPYGPERLLTVRRFADKDMSLFSTLNVIQENLTQRNLSRHGRGSRAVNSIDVDTRLNRELFAAASQFIATA